MSLEALQKSCNIPKSNFFHIFTILGSYLPASKNTDDILTLNPYAKSNISKIYTNIQSIHLRSWGKTKALEKLPKMCS